MVTLTACADSLAARNHDATSYYLALLGEMASRGPHADAPRGCTSPRRSCSEWCARGRTSSAVPRHPAARAHDGAMPCLLQSLTMHHVQIFYKHVDLVRNGIYLENMKL